MRRTLLPDFMSGFQVQTCFWVLGRAKTSEGLPRLGLLGCVYRRTFRLWSFFWVSADWPEGEGSNTTREGLIQASMGMRCTAGMGSAWVDSLWSQLESIQAQCGCSFLRGAGLFLWMCSGLKKRKSSKHRSIWFGYVSGTIKRSRERM